MVPKTVSCWAFGRKVVPKRRCVGLLGWNFLPKTTSCWLFGRKLFTKTALFRPCMNYSIEALRTSWTRLSLFSLFSVSFFQTATLLLITLSSLSLSSRFPFQNPPRSSQTSPTTKSTLLKHSNFPNVTHFFAPVDKTTRETKKQPSKDKGQFTFPFSSVIFNFLWVETMIGLSLWNILTLVHVS